MKFTKGDKLICNTDRHSFITKGNTYEALSDIDRDGDVLVADDDGDKNYYYAGDFDLAATKPFSSEDLKLFQRVKFANGEFGIVAFEGSVPKLICKGNTWCSVNFSYGDYRIVEVYEAPAFYNSFNFDVRGELVWDDARARKLAAADKAIAEAEAALAAAKAAKAAL